MPIELRNPNAPLDLLLRKVVKKFKGDPNTVIRNADIMDLEVELTLSRATLQRLFGIDNTNPNRTYRKSTQNLLAQYVGYKDYNEFLREGRETPLVQTAPTNAKRKSKKKRISSLYVKDLVEKSLDLGETLQQILSGEAYYLKERTRINKEQKYNYRYALYEFCALLGALKIVEQDLKFSNYYLPNTTEIIFNFRTALVEHPDVKYQQLRSLCELWKLENTWLTTENAPILGKKIERVIEQYSIQYDIRTIDDLTETVKHNLLDDVSTILHKAMPFPVNPITWKNLQKNADRAIQKLFQIQAWLFYGWQNGIAQLMIKSQRKGKNNFFFIIEFNDFESIYLNKTAKKYRWIRRVKGVFSDLDMRIPAKYDARIVQLEKTYAANIQLLEAFISLTDLTRDAKVNGRFYNLKKF